MRAFYRHTQTSSWMRALFFLAAVGMCGAGAVVGRPAAFGLIAVALILAGAGWAFSALTVEVTAESLTWYFGPGVWMQSLDRDSIASATCVENKWWWGFGVHFTPRGWLYNVAGLRGVEIACRSGRTLRIGSDEPEALAAALRPSPSPRMI